MDFDREELRLLAALWIDHHGRDRLLSAGDLTVDYGVRLPDRWLESMAVTLEGKGWATVYRSLSDVALGLRPEGYRAGMKAALELTGGSAIEVQFDQREILGDGAVPADMPGGPGWKYFDYDTPSETPAVVVAPGSRAMEMVALDHADPGHAKIRQVLTEVIDLVDGDNELHDGKAAALRLRNAASLWSGTNIRVIELRVGILMAIDDVCEKVVGAYYAGAVAALALLVRSFAKDKLHIDMDDLL